MTADAGDRDLPGPRPWLSVVMPVHNGAAFLAETLESLAAESGDGIELVLLDSSPDERSLDIARGFASRLDLALGHWPDLPGWPDKTNLAVAQARADHVVMLHQDDLWLPGRAAALRRWIAGDADAALHLGPTDIIGPGGRRLGQWRCPLPVGRVDEAMLAERLSVQNFVSVPAPLFRRDAFLAVGGLDPALWYTADWDLWIKLARHGPVRHHDEVTTAFRVHGGSLTMRGSCGLADFEQQLREVLERHGDWHRGHGRPPVIEASVGMNVALAAAAAGDAGRLIRAGWSLLALGPANLMRYLRFSRLAERLWPRLRCKVAGEL